MLKSTVLGLGAKLVISVGTFFIIPLLLNKLGATSFGIWMTISSTLWMLGFLDLGLGNTLINISSDQNLQKKDLAVYITNAYCIQLSIAGVLIISFAVLFNHINWADVFNIKGINKDVLQAIFISFICFFASLSFNSIYSIQRGLQRSDIANLWQLINSLVYLGLLYVVVSWYSIELKWIALVTFGVPLLLSFVNTCWYFNKVNISLFKHRNLITRKNIFSLLSRGLPFFYLQFAAIILFQSDTIIIAHVLTFGDVAKYTVCAKLFSIPGVLLGVYAQVLWPAYAKHFSLNNWKWIKNKFYESIIISFVVLIIFITFLIFAKNIFLKLWIGTSIQIPDSLIIGFITWIILSVGIDGNLATIMNSLGLLRMQIFSSIFMIVSNLLISIFLAGKIGVAGVIWGTVISTALFSTIPQLIYVLRYVKRKSELGQLICYE